MAKSVRRFGFTLLELLVVIAIIALLISILVPALSSAREHSRGTVCRTQLRELARAEFAYATTHGVFTPCIDNYSFSGLNSNTFGLDWLGIGDQFGAFAAGNPLDPTSGNPKGFAAAPRFGLLWTYYMEPKLILCPSDYFGDYQPSEMVPPGNGKFSYTMIAGMGMRPPERIPAAAHFGGTIRSPSDAPLFVEEHPDGCNNLHREGNFWAGFGTPPPDGGDKFVSRHGPFTNRQGIRPGAGSITNFQQGTTNVGFADGHVDQLRPNFGFGQSHILASGMSDRVPNNVVGLLYRYGIKYELLAFPDN